MPSTNAARLVSPGLRERVQKFESFSSRPRVVLSGHGAWDTADGLFVPPLGVKVFFYTYHRQPLSNIEGLDVDQLTGKHAPVEVCVGGIARIPNYTLFPPRELIIGYEGINLAMFTVSRDRGVTLKALLQHSGCRNADVHWAACRSERARTSSR